MSKLSKIARGLDVFFKVASWVFIALAVIMAIVAIAIQFGDAATGQELGRYAFVYNGIKVQCNAEGAQALPFIEDARRAFLVSSAVIVIGIALVWLAIRTIRQILEPMKEGKPFDGVVGSKLRTLGILTLVCGVVGNIMNVVGHSIVDKALQEVEGGMYTLSLTNNYDVTFILIAVILFLFSYIFRYGEELQKQSDETL